MMKLGEWHIEPATPDGVPARCALIIEPMETMYPADEKLAVVDYYRAVDFMSYGGPRLTDRYGISREKPAAPVEPAPVVVE